jgi:hypothetical protein
MIHTERMLVISSFVQRCSCTVVLDILYQYLIPGVLTKLCHALDGQNQ